MIVQISRRQGHVSFEAPSDETPGIAPIGLYGVPTKTAGGSRPARPSCGSSGCGCRRSRFYLGFIWIFIDGRRRGWHDLIAGTGRHRTHSILTARR